MNFLGVRGESIRHGTPTYRTYLVAAHEDPSEGSSSSVARREGGRRKDDVRDVALPTSRSGVSPRWSVSDQGLWVVTPRAYRRNPTDRGLFEVRTHSVLKIPETMSVYLY